MSSKQIDLQNIDDVVRISESKLRGSVIDGEYMIDRSIGEGNQGKVFKAQNIANKKMKNLPHPLLSTLSTRPNL